MGWLDDNRMRVVSESGDGSLVLVNARCGLLALAVLLHPVVAHFVEAWL